jgi:serine/threonine-protein kinase
VVQPIDVVAEGGDLLYVMEYVHGVSLAHLLDEARAQSAKVPEEITIAVMVDVLSALHAAHEAKDEAGRPLGVVHRDVSPQNVLVGLDGVARLADFGVAKAMGREERTATGAVKGKPAYMSPEQQRGLPLSRQADVHAAGVVLAVALTGAPLAPPDDGPTEAWLREMIAAISDPELRDVVVTATKAQARDRYATAAEMARALASVRTRAPLEAVGACVQDLAGDVLERRAELARRVESADGDAAEAAAAASSTTPARGSRQRPVVVAPRTDAAPVVARNADAAPVVARAAAAAPVATRSLRPALVVALSASVVVGAFLVLRATTRAEPVPLPPREPVTTPVAVLEASAAPPTALAPAVSVAAPPPSPSPPPASSAVARPRAVAPRPHAPPPEERAPPVDCDPPFRIDAQGRKHYKPECNP